MFTLEGWVKKVAKENGMKPDDIRINSNGTGRTEKQEGMGKLYRKQDTDKSCNAT